MRYLRLRDTKKAFVVFRVGESARLDAVFYPSARWRDRGVGACSRSVTL